MTRTYGLHRHFASGKLEGKRAKLGREIFMRVLGYFAPYWRQWAVIAVCILIVAGLNVLPPLCVGAILDNAIPNEDMSLLSLLAGAMVLLAIATGLTGVLQQSLTAKAGQSVLYDLRQELFTHLQLMSLNFYKATRSGEIVSRINNDVEAVQMVSTTTFVSIGRNLATLAATSIALFSMNWRLAIVAVLIVPLFYFPSRIVGRIRHRLSQQTQERKASLLAYMQELLHVDGAILTKSYGRRTDDAAGFGERSDLVRTLMVRQAVIGRWLFMILSVFSAVGPAMIYWYGGYQVIQNELTPGLLVAFAALLTLLYRPLVQLASVYGDIHASFAVFERIFEYLDLRPDITDPDEPLVLDEVEGHVRYENLSFKYKDSDAYAKRNGKGEPFELNNVSFEILPGEKVGLVGPSGSGKTTLTYFLLRFIDPDAGKVTLDGVDLRKFEQEKLREHIGMVTQETFLFNATVRQNLLYAKPGATEEDMREACAAANIQTFIDSLPEGLDTLVGERGFRLSGGEKQRLSIARALLKDPDILILDEATSSLDSTSEGLIQRALRILLEGRTSLIIAHRLSTIVGCDRIVVLDRGEVADIGTHEELLNRGGIYAEFCEQQFGDTTINGV
ncbi:MAG: ABC transporter ATP-binding protein [Planctomycetota bacterium]|nr:ABC transporter ATP-binding protein [Planctomycetota bacterium]